MGKFCRNCGAQLEENQNVCLKCGTIVEEENNSQKPAETVNDTGSIGWEFSDSLFLSQVLFFISYGRIRSLKMQKRQVKARLRVLSFL